MSSRTDEIPDMQPKVQSSRSTVRCWPVASLYWQSTVCVRNRDGLKATEYRPREFSPQPRVVTENIHRKYGVVHTNARLQECKILHVVGAQM